MIEPFMLGRETPMDPTELTIHVVYDLGYVSVRDINISHWTGAQFKNTCDRLFKLKGNFYLEGWDLLEDDKPLYLQGIPLHFCGFIFHESVRGMDMSQWCKHSRNRRQGTQYHQQKMDRKILDSKKTEE